MSMFRAKKMDIGSFLNIKVIRDHTKRKVFAEHEPERQALRYIIRNTTLPARTRAEAQLQLTQMHCYTRPTQIRGRCILGGKGRGIFRDFKMSRYNFRMQALEGNLPGVRKASCHSFYGLKELSRNIVFVTSPLPSRSSDESNIDLSSLGLSRATVDKMFYRPWEELPADPDFPSDLGELGYFVNDDDEIRSRESPDHYFKYFINKNERYNERQRYAMNEAIEKVVHARLESLGLEKIRLPLGTPSDKPNVPIFVSSDIKSKSRVILVIGETYQDLGIIAHRILGGRGGVNKGSMVSVVETLKSQPSSCSDPSAPGFILANTGQFIWHESLKRCHTISSTHEARMPSAVHAGPKWYVEVGKDRVEGNRDAREHIKTIFENVIPAFLNKEAGIDIVAVGDGADALEKYLDWSETWKKLSDKINCLAILGGYYAIEDLQSTNFREFLREKARAYSTSVEPLGTPLSGPDGNPNTATFTSIGAPVYSGGESHYTETLLIHALPHLAQWLLEVTMAGRKEYRNPKTPILYCDPENEALKMEPDWSKWENASPEWPPSADVGDAGPSADVANNDGDDEAKVKVEDLDDDECDQDVKKLAETLGMMNAQE